jgi:hypothetical protein
MSPPSLAPEHLSPVTSVRVTVRYFREDVRDVAQACLVERGEGVGGVGVFVSVLSIQRIVYVTYPYVMIIDTQVVVHWPWGQQVIIHGNHHRFAL